jgi:GNAT superfamily N-acetyltransferase
MHPEDAEAIHAIHCACLTITLSRSYSHEQITAWMSGRTPQGYLRAAAFGERFFVAELDNSIRGFASWQKDELLALFVHPDHQFQGIGSALFKACLADANGAITRVKAVRGADGFYARHGFTIECHGSTIKRGVEIPDIRMRRTLVQPFRN